MLYRRFVGQRFIVASGRGVRLGVRIKVAGLLGIVYMMDWLMRTMAVALGLGCVADSFRKDPRIRYGLLVPGPCAHTINQFGRICIFLVGFVLIFYGLTGIKEYWHFPK